MAAKVLCAFGLFLKQTIYRKYPRRLRIAHLYSIRSCAGSDNKSTNAE